MKRWVRERLRRLMRALAPTMLSSVESVPALQDRVVRLERQLSEHRERAEGYRRRIEALEAESHDARLLQLRIAELTDIVQELLLPAADRDEDRLAEMRQRYASSL